MPHGVLVTSSYRHHEWSDFDDCHNEKPYHVLLNMSKTNDGYALPVYFHRQIATVRLSKPKAQFSTISKAIIPTGSFLHRHRTSRGGSIRRREIVYASPPRPSVQSPTAGTQANFCCCHCL